MITLLQYNSTWAAWLILLCLTACSSGAPSQPAPEVLASPISIVPDSLVYAVPYELTQPKDTLFLSSQLVEISGLSYVEPEQLATIQDERGILYMLDKNSGEIVKEINFGKSGDYEGIEVVEGNAYVIKSSGKVTEIPNVLSDPPGETHEYNNALKSDDDTEGLGYDPRYNQLLIACKEPYRTERGEVKDQRAIYGYDLTSHKLKQMPVFTVKTEEIAAFLKAYGPKEKWATSFEPQKKSSFKPSGIAIHPQTGLIYMIASVGKLLLVLNESYQVVAVKHLPRSTFLQPEGICFSPDGELYISNEGGNGKGYILHFAPISSP